MDAPIRLTGKVIWLDLETGDTVDTGTLTRGILRPDGFAMDLTSTFGTYSISLARDGRGRLEGNWTLTRHGQQETGVAKCTVELQDEDTYILAGLWNRGACHWFGALEKVDAF